MDDSSRIVPAGKVVPAFSEIPEPSLAEPAVAQHGQIAGHADKTRAQNRWLDRLLVQ